MRNIAGNYPQNDLNIDKTLRDSMKLLRLSRPGLLELLVEASSSYIKTPNPESPKGIYTTISLATLSERGIGENRRISLVCGTRREHRKTRFDAKIGKGLNYEDKRRTESRDDNYRGRPSSSSSDGGELRNYTQPYMLESLGVYTIYNVKLTIRETECVPGVLLGGTWQRAGQGKGRFISQLEGREKSCNQEIGYTEVKHNSFKGGNEANDNEIFDQPSNGPICSAKMALRKNTTGQEGQMEEKETRKSQRPPPSELDSN
ncbi:hypothetical protein WH47_04829 [Habropoda laboriosa]|uniref:Uncharacterized protein n=1 Tax=Habropoda laboriosa TaxID=597456 RepID=A0A0L7QVT5_9HYME|nr:hypothetical protein WH47_04829 [Habropoda laboriosa]